MTVPLEKIRAQGRRFYSVAARLDELPPLPKHPDQGGIADRLGDISKRYEESRPRQTEETAPFHLPPLADRCRKMKLSRPAASFAR